MKVIYRGGYNKRDKQSVRNSMFYEYANTIKTFSKEGKEVVVVTFAKPDKYYDDMLKDALGLLPEIINTQTPKGVPWEKYDLILLPGGNDLTLKEYLIDYGFDVNKLKEECVIIGDSAGATVMARNFVWKTENITNNSMKYTLEEGLHPESNLLVIPHADNPYYVSEKELEKAEALNRKLNLKQLLLKENEAKLLENGQLVDFDIEALLTV